MQKMIIANWKMHLGVRESVALAKATLQMLQGKEVIPQVVLCPAFTALADVHKVLARSRVALGAQDVGPDKFGAYTGSIGVGHLIDVGCSYAIIGHSERRMHAGETNEIVREKARALAEAKSIVPIVCVGETEEEYRAGNALDAATRMLRRSLAAVAFPRSLTPIVAYEPVWAVGKGAVPSVAETLAVIRALRLTLDELFPGREPSTVLYGGSVDKETAYAFLREPEIDGVLVGGASLRVQEFQGIVQEACAVLTYQA